MYLRWKTSPYWRTKFVWTHAKADVFKDQVYHGKERDYAGNRLTAVLVKSERIDGKPRQRTVAYLGHIRDYHTYSLLERWLFWRDVDWRLDTLSLPPEQREQIEAAIQARIPRLTEEERAQYEKKREDDKRYLRAHGHNV